MNTLRTTLAITAVLALTACGGSNAESPEWDDLPGGGDALKELIDQDAAAGNCESLQGFFDVWVEHKTPDGLVLMDVVDYIDDKMREAGCYE